MVVLCVFVISYMGSALKNASVFDVSQTINDIFLDNGIALLITVIILGQLTAQVNAAVCLLDFINNYFHLFTVYLSLGIEMSGLLHSVYLVNVVFAKITGNPTPTNEPEKSGLTLTLFWARVVGSLFCLSFSLAVVVEALLDETTKMWDGVPAGAR